MKKLIIIATLLIPVLFSVSCAKQQEDLIVPAQDVLAQKAAALNLIKDYIINNPDILVDEESMVSASNILDSKIGQLYPLAFTTPSVALTKSNTSEPISSLIPCDLMGALKETILFDIEKYQAITAEYFQSEDFLGLNNEQQANIKLYLDALELYRNTIVETTLCLLDNPETKVSGAEMRGWRDMAKDMPEDQRGKVVDSFFTGASAAIGLLPAGGPIGVCIALTGWLICMLR